MDIQPANQDTVMSAHRGNARLKKMRVNRVQTAQTATLLAQVTGAMPLWTVRNENAVHIGLAISHMVIGAQTLLLTTTAIGRTSAKRVFATAKSVSRRRTTAQIASTATVASPTYVGGPYTRPMRNVAAPSTRGVLINGVRI
jgi:hypothetical protein